MTVGARLYRVEQHLSNMDKKMDQVIHALNIIAQHRNTPTTLQAMPANTTKPLTSSQGSSPTPIRLLDDDI